MLQHYSGSLGEFDYDDKLWKLVETQGQGSLLEYIGESCDVEIPKGLKTFNYLFNERVFDNTFRILMIDTNTGNSKMFSHMFNKCHFKSGLDLGNFTYKYADSMFSKCVFYGKLNFGSNFYVGNCCFEGSTFKKGCNLLSIKTSSDRVDCCLKDCKLNDDFCLPDVLSSVFESDFSDKVVCPLRFPSYVMSESDSFELYGLNIKLFDFDEDEYQQAVNYVSEQLNDAVKKMIFVGKNKSHVSKEVIAMLKQRKSKDDVLSTLVSKGMSFESANSLYSNTVKPLKGKCKNDIAKIFVVEGKSSKYTVGEVREYLQDRGYPKEIVNNCLLEYLKNEYLV